MIAQTARLVDDDGTGLEVLRLDSSLGVTLTSLDLGTPDIRTAVSDRTGQDGTDDQTQFIGARPIVAELLMPAVGWYAVEDVLRGVMHPSTRYYLYVLRDGWAAERRVLVRPSTPVFPPREPRLAQLAWSGIRGVLEDQPQRVTLVPIFSGAEGGTSTPFSTPVTLAPGYNPGSTAVTVAGTAKTSPVAVIYGPCTNPTLVCGPTQDVLAFNLTIAAGDYLRVDFGARTALLNGNTLQSQYGRLDFTRSTWWTLRPGTQQVSFNPSAASGASQALLSWRPRYV